MRIQEREDHRLVPNARARGGTAARDGEREALVEARAVAIATLEVVKENDFTYPGPSDWKRIVGPILEARMVSAERFVWTFKGGKTEGIVDLRRTELGHIESTGREAVAYVDGTARLRER